jgi:hypothetical protein
VTETVIPAVVTLGAANTEQELGISYRQLDWWTRLGLLRPLHVGGSGVNREWTRAELEVARLMGRLVAAGMKPAMAERIARSRRCEIAPGTWLHLGPPPSGPCDRGDHGACFPDEPADCGCECHGEQP